MHKHKLYILPKPIKRNKYVKLVFDLGLQHDHDVSTMISAVIIGDEFISYKGVRIPYIPKNNGKYCDMLVETVPPFYSKELAYVTTVLSAKMNEDKGYKNTNDAIFDTENYYIVKIEWEVLFILNFHVKISNFIIMMYNIIAPQNRRFADYFWDLSREICLDEKLLYTSEKTVILACALLSRNNKLRAVKKCKKRMFKCCLEQLSYEYEVDMSDIIREIINEYKIISEG